MPALDSYADPKSPPQANKGNLSFGESSQANKSNLSSGTTYHSQCLQVLAVEEKL